MSQKVAGKEKKTHIYMAYCSSISTQPEYNIKNIPKSQCLMEGWIRGNISNNSRSNNIKPPFEFCLTKENL